MTQPHGAVSCMLEHFETCFTKLCTFAVLFSTCLNIKQCLKENILALGDDCPLCTTRQGYMMC